MKKEQLKSLVRGCYDLQKLRIQIGNRVVANFRSKLGYDAGEKNKDDKEKDKILNKIKKEYKLLTDGIIDNLPTKKQFFGKELISEYSELILVNNYMLIYQAEERAFKDLGKVLDNFKIWNDFLKSVKGVGPAMAGIIISEIDIEKATYPSSVWMYAGLDVAPDGRGRSKKKEHLVKQKYIDKEGNEQEKNGITFNPLLKTKLLGVLGGSFLKSKSEYSEYYYNYRNRIENHPDHKEKTKLHKHNMSNRYMIKRFLVDLHIKWREIEGLPVHPEYSEGKLGMKHKKAA